LLYALLHVSVLAEEGYRKCNEDNKICDKNENCSEWEKAGECFKNKPYMDQNCHLSCTEGCSDASKRCSIWASLRECEENPVVMQKYCPRSCGYCDTCIDKKIECPQWVKKGECSNNPLYMKKFCEKSCNFCKSKHSVPLQVDNKTQELVNWTTTIGIRQIAHGDDAQQTLAVIQATKEYWEQNATLSLPENVTDKCLNHEPLCSFWASLNECENNPGYMTRGCAPACRSCHVLMEDETKGSTKNNDNATITTLCPNISGLHQSFRSGRLNPFFERLHANSDHKTTALSRPSAESSSSEIHITSDLSQSPWLLKLDSFLTTEECTRWLNLGESLGYHSRNIENKSNDVVSSCSFASGCRQQAVSSGFLQRLTQSFSVPVNYVASLEIHKHIPKLTNREARKPKHGFGEEEKIGGPRVLSLVVFLDHGQTISFPQLGITVDSKPGTALLWPNVFNSNSTKRDHRLMHRHELSQKESDSEKTSHTLQTGIHLYDIATSEANGCFEASI